MRVLIVEDEKGLAAEIKEFLVKEEFNCDLALTGKEASDLIAINPYDFILLDIGLPDYNGLDLIKEAKRSNSEAYFIVITARGELEDKIKGFDLGADDYLAKPFSLLELLSRIQAITRRKFGHQSSIIQFGNFALDTIKKHLEFDNKAIDLTKKEYKLLSYLVLNKNRVLDRLQLTEHIWGEFYEDDYDSNYIDVHIKNIRKKLSEFDETNWIKTVRGIGYKFEIE
ncbi:MAG: DNA-binding response regulator [Bacteroidetes bacterium GWF2_33_16]|nr:MAG: DNA-binding response regulator [Bacteroidetes bacterium GWE2_32_14]OFY04565.1 MAG: DNA-binding response regulator [Bacteroidetes bacterium GWF2_33_16]